MALRKTEAMTRPDGRWIQEALERHEGPLLQYARRITGDLERARDVVQETFLRLCRQPRAAVEERLGEWLYTVCRNAALDVRRKELRMRDTESVAREDAATEFSTTSAPDAAVADREERGRALKLLQRLPPRQQEALRLRFQGGLSYREIARVTGSSIGNVGYLIHVGLLRLREELRLSEAPGAMTS